MKLTLLTVRYRQQYCQQRHESLELVCQLESDQNVSCRDQHWLAINAGIFITPKSKTKCLKCQQAKDICCKKRPVQTSIKIAVRTGL